MVADLGFDPGYLVGNELLGLRGKRLRGELSGVEVCVCVEYFEIGGKAFTVARVI